MTFTDRIEVNPEVMLGRPVIRGTRVPVELLLRKLSEGASEADLLDAYPQLIREDIQAAMLPRAARVAHSLPLVRDAAITQTDRPQPRADNGRGRARRDIIRGPRGRRAVTPRAVGQTRSTTVRPQKMKAFASFDEWKRDQTAKNQRLIDELSELVKKTAPEFTPTVKWGQGCWILGDTPRVYIHAEPDHVQFGFYAGTQLKDPGGLLVGSGKHVRHVKVFTTKGIPRKALVALLEQVR